MPFLEPAFVVDATPMLPDSAGEWRITGRAADGRRLFDLSFAMPEVAHSDGAGGFAFTLPTRSAWADALASITLSGPTGEAILDGTSNNPMAILRDLQTGDVRAFLSDLTAEEAAQAAEGAVCGETGRRSTVQPGDPRASVRVGQCCSDDVRGELCGSTWPYGCAWHLRCSA